MLNFDFCCCSGCQGNVGLIFTKGDLKEVSEEVAKYKVKLLDPLLHNRCIWFFLFMTAVHLMPV